MVPYMPVDASVNFRFEPSKLRLVMCMQRAGQGQVRREQGAGERSGANRAAR